MIGIYQIWIGEHYYFGSSVSIKERLQKHLSQLKKNKHPNKFMQAQYNKVKNFSYYIVYECSKKELLLAEQEYINTHYGLHNCMNICPDAIAPPSNKGIPKGPQTEEHKRNSGIAKGKQVIIDGVEYYSAAEAARQLGFRQSVISRWANGERKCSYGLEVRYK